MQNVQVKPYIFLGAIAYEVPAGIGSVISNLVYYDNETIFMIVPDTSNEAMIFATSSDKMEMYNSGDVWAVLRISYRLELGRYEIISAYAIDDHVFGRTEAIRVMNSKSK